ncbi:MAG TPA: hypothetical protein VJ925_12385 [Longimicrobiales bacterium]|nr:hypothetical protein [Longimicrobiales bacterium]
MRGDSSSTGSNTAERMRTGGLGLLVILVTLALSASGATAQDPVDEMDTMGLFDQDPAPPIMVWGSYGVGSAFVTDGGDPQDAPQVARFTLERGSSSLIVHYATVGQAFGPGSDEVNEIGALYGRALNRGVWKLWGGVGLARLSGFECIEADDPLDCDGSGTFGFPAFLEFMVRPLPFVGIGAQAFTTVSPDGSWGGFGLIGHVGRLR